ncbi:hypothetical protein EIK77_005493 [Talaromyces pinophilus]|nr:hypothetical protein EIK77_005493 [Talaromyces pinophilus]
MPAHPWSNIKVYQDDSSLSTNLLDHFTHPSTGNFEKRKKMPSSTSNRDPSPCPFHLSTILGVFPNLETNCVGFAQTKGRRCTLPASDIRGRAQASRILDEGTRLLESGEENIHEMLEELAPLLLCRRNHQGQAGRLAYEWSGKVEKFHERRRASAGFLLRSPSPLPAPQRDSESVRARGYRARAYTADRGSPASPTTINEIERDDSSRSIRRSSAPPRFDNSEQVDTLSNPSPTTTATMDQPRSHTPRTPVISATSWAPFENNLQAYYAQHAQRGAIVFESRNLRPVPQTTFSTSRITISESNGRQPTATSSTSSAQTRSEVGARTSTSRESTRPARNPTRRQTSLREEITRRPVQGECNICFLPLQEDESDTDRHEVEDSDDFSELHAHPRIVYEGLVWCRRQCGNNFHRDCMDSWIHTFEDRFERDGRRPTCPICRAEWVEGQ